MCTVYIYSTYVLCMLYIYLYICLQKDRSNENNKQRTQHNNIYMCCVASLFNTRYVVLFCCYMFAWFVMCLLFGVPHDASANGAHAPPFPFMCLHVLFMLRLVYVPYMFRTCFVYVHSFYKSV